MLTGFNKLSNNDIPNAIKPLQAAMNQLNNNMVEIAINTNESLKTIVNTQNKIQGIIQKALSEEFGNVTLMKRFDETNEKLNKIGEFLTGTGIELGFNKTLNEKLDAIFKKAGTSPEEIATLNTSLSETQKSVRNINQNLAALRLNVQSLASSKEPIDSSQIEKLKNENFNLLGQVTLLNDEKLKLEQQVDVLSNRIGGNINNLDLEKQSLRNEIALAQQANREAQLKIINLMKEKADEAVRNTALINKFKEEVGELVDESIQLSGENEDIKELLLKKDATINELFQGKNIHQIFFNVIEDLKKNSVDIETAKSFIKETPLFGQLPRVSKLVDILKKEMERISFSATKDLRENNQVLDEVLATKTDRRSVKEDSKVDIKKENKKKFIETQKEERLKAQNIRRTQEAGGDTIITDAPVFQPPTAPQITPTQQPPVFKAAVSKPLTDDNRDELERRFGFTEEDAKNIIELREKSTDLKFQIKEVDQESKELRKESVKIHRFIKAGIDVESNTKRQSEINNRITELTELKTKLIEDRKEFKKAIELQQQIFLEEQGNRNRIQNETVQQVLNLDKIDKATKILQRELKFKEFVKEKAKKQRTAKLEAKSKILALSLQK